MLTRNIARNMGFQRQHAEETRTARMRYRMHVDFRAVAAMDVGYGVGLPFDDVVRIIEMLDAGASFSRIAQRFRADIRDIRAIAAAATREDIRLADM